MSRLPHIILGASLLVAVSLATAPLGASASSPGVLLVGSYHGVGGRYHTIQAAVDAARPGDWILVGPGDYHARGSAIAGVYITTPGIHLRGMDRNRVIIDGTTSSAATPCDPSPSVQNFGAPDAQGDPRGWNGVEVYKAPGVSIENLTACNYLASAGGDNGNEIWFNGGDKSGKVGLGSFHGAYLTASSTYYKDANSAMAQYGIFSSNAYGPGVFTETYASNMGDSAYYIGACADCNTILSHGHAENSALGYSGSNAGGHLILEDSEWDNNRTGLAPNSLNNDDAPPPQNGACPHGGIGPTGTHSCMMIRGNYIHNNNNPNVPSYGLAGSGAVGTGLELSGSANVTVLDNRIENNASYGVLINDYPDFETPPAVAHCTGGASLPLGLCYFPAHGDQVIDNHFSHNGFYGNLTNGDIADAALPGIPDGNCFSGNLDPAGGVTSAPPDIQTVNGVCGLPNSGDMAMLLLQVSCATQAFGNCPSLPGATYPLPTNVQMLPIPVEPTMPNPCLGVPTNPWCRSGANTIALVPAANGFIAAGVTVPAGRPESSSTSAWLLTIGLPLACGVADQRRRTIRRFGARRRGAWPSNT